MRVTAMSGYKSQDVPTTSKKWGKKQRKSKNKNGRGEVEGEQEGPQPQAKSNQHTSYELGLQASAA